jgi:transcriptional regulator with XRE-family HTH domain
MAKKFSDLVADWSPERVDAVHARVREMLRELPLVELRRQLNLSEAEIARELGIPEARISKLERRSDVYLRTLRRYIEAMGGQLEITARFPDGEIRLDEWSAWMDEHEFPERADGLR